MLEKTPFNTLPAGLQEKLEQLSFTTPTKVQEQVIPAVSAKKNIVFQSETGTGKTFAYLLPLLQRIMENNAETSPNERPVLVIICAPTFELASQIKQTAMAVSNIKTALFIGGAPIKRQLETLKEKPQIVIGTPARLLELIRLKKLKTQHIFAIVFDEADRLVKKELYDESRSLVLSMPENVQKIACTATVDSSTKKFFSDCELLLLPAENVLTKNITHWAIYAENRDKIETLRKLIIAENPSKALVFTSRADQVENIYSKLKYKKIEMIKEYSRDRQLSGAFFLRIISCLPYDIVSLAMGSLRFDYKKFLLGSFLGTAPGFILTTIMGSAITEPLSPEFLICAGAEVFITIVSALAYKLHKSRAAK